MTADSLVVWHTALAAAGDLDEFIWDEVRDQPLYARWRRRGSGRPREVLRYDSLNNGQCECITHRLLVRVWGPWEPPIPNSMRLRVLGSETGPDVIDTTWLWVLSCWSFNTTVPCTPNCVSMIEAMLDRVDAGVGDVDVAYAQVNHAYNFERRWKAAKKAVLERGLGSISYYDGGGGGPR